MAQLSTLRGRVRDELSEQTAGIWLDTQLNSWLNRGVEYLVSEYYRGKCWQLLQPITRYTTYSLTTSNDVVDDDTWSLYQVLNNWTYWHDAGSDTKVPTKLTNYYGYVHGMLGNYVLHEANVKEFHRLHATTGEYAPSTTTPWIIFWGKDRTHGIIEYSGGGTYEPKEGDYMYDAADEDNFATYIHKIKVDTGTWAGGDAAGYMTIYDSSGTAVSAMTLRIGEEADVATLGDCQHFDDIDHGDLPYFTIRPALTATTTLHFWWLEDPTEMSAATDEPQVDNSDELLVLYATARAWKANRNFDMHAAMWQEFQVELQKKIANYQELTFKSL